MKEPMRTDDTESPTPPPAAGTEARIADLPPGLRSQLGGSSFQGLATFMQVPLVTESEQLDAGKRPDVAIVGAPWDGSTTNRPGARYGPRALRAEAYNPSTYHLDLEVDLLKALDVVDYGDAICPHGMTELS